MLNATFIPFSPFFPAFIQTDSDLRYLVDGVAVPLAEVRSSTKAAGGDQNGGRVLNRGVYSHGGAISQLHNVQRGCGLQAV